MRHFNASFHIFIFLRIEMKWHRMKEKEMEPNQTIHVPRHVKNKSDIINIKIPTQLYMQCSLCLCDKEKTSE